MTGYYLDALANLYLKANDLPAAEAAARRGARRLRAVAAGRSISTSPPRDRLLGEILLRRGSLAAAEAELRAALDINTALAGAGQLAHRAQRREPGLGA